MTQKHRYTPNWNSNSGRRSPYLPASETKAERDRREAAEEAKRREPFERMARGESPFVEPEEKF